MFNFDLGARVGVRTNRRRATVTHPTGVDHNAIQTTLSQHKVALPL